MAKVCLYGDKRVFVSERIAVLYQFNMYMLLYMDIVQFHPIYLAWVVISNPELNFLSWKIYMEVQLKTAQVGLTLIITNFYTVVWWNAIKPRSAWFLGTESKAAEHVTRNDNTKNCVVGWGYHQVIDDLSVAHVHYPLYLQANNWAAPCNWLKQRNFSF